jgi:hypothetical protein
LAGAKSNDAKGARWVKRYSGRGKKKNNSNKAGNGFASYRAGKSDKGCMSPYAQHIIFRARRPIISASICQTKPISPLISRRFSLLSGEGKDTEFTFFM